MRLSDVSVSIRPRNAWEALDLGTLMARQHGALLMLSWAIITVPVFAVLCLLFWDSPGWAVLIFWWLKPVYERLPLHIISRSVFGETLTLKAALREYPRLIRPQLLASLTWRRLSMRRSFYMPVQQLEGLAGRARNDRIAVLGLRDARPATWLTLVGVHIETALYLGGISLFYLMLPGQIETDWSWQNLLEATSHDWLWLEHLSNLIYVLVLIIWEPIYVACGFSLYLNRRTVIEAWDLELVFRQIRQRVSGAATALLLGCALLLSQLPTQAMAASDTGATAMAATPMGATSETVIAHPQVDPLGPDAERLGKQPLNSKQAQESIHNLLDQPPFENRQTVTGWRLSSNDESDKAKNADWLETLIKGYKNLAEFWDSLRVLNQIFEILLWAALAGLIVTLIWRYRDWLRTFSERLKITRPQQRRQPEEQLFDLAVTPQSLPDNISAEAQRLWDTDPRAALSLLYRAMLSRLLHDHALALKTSHTESEVLACIETLEQPALNQFSQLLTQHWQNLAYGHRLPPASLKQQLCTGWDQVFEREGHA
ncbi:MULTISPECIES: DUF4129 domain-containing protein [Pseudomonas]|uniref:DUF4129 domain-containing protein n=1 Tax=Pseudomonas TaxID=286 RepID=UPI00300169ED